MFQPTKPQFAIDEYVIDMASRQYGTVIGLYRTTKGIRYSIVFGIESDHLFWSVDRSETSLQKLNADDMDIIQLRLLAGETKLGHRPNPK